MRPRTFLLIATLAACQPTEPAEPLMGAALVTREEAACEADGGRWGTGSREGTFVCYRTPADAGQTCSADGDCEGLCLARSRTCAPVTPMFGCHEVLGRLGARSTLCIE
ncbi:MAG: hypothetical protein AAGA71_00070 [Pseudomonadota bacterium]